ncbi:MAG: MFS transporter [Pseudomonadota bacterium]
MNDQRLRFLFLNIGHFLDHLFVLIFATAALRLTLDWNMSYAELIPYATPGFVAFGLCAIPAGWLADKWSREGMMVVFFIGIGVCSIIASFAETPMQMALSLTAVGVFAAIYHPVGLAMVVQGLEKTGVPLAINGIFGNMGVASAALLTGFLVDTAGWKSAFIVPGCVSIAVGIWFLLFVRAGRAGVKEAAAAGAAGRTDIPTRLLIRFFAVILITTALGGLVFQSTTFALPKVFDERLTDIAGTATLVGFYAFITFTVAAFAQLVVGYLVDHYPVRTVFAAVAGLQAVFFFVMAQLDGIAALLVAVAFMLVVFGQIPINDVLIGRIARSAWRSRAYALRYIVTFTVSATAVPLIAWIHSGWGFALLFSALAYIALGIFVTTLFLPERSRVPEQAAV